MKHIFAIFTLLTAIPLMGQNAKWISANEESVDSPNTWVAFRKDFDVGKVPSSANAKIAVDSKYWLWINGKLAVFEGGLKRGPNPKDGYFDEVDIAPFLKEGQNKLAILVWYFGKDGFSHKSSGKLGLFFDSDALNLKSDSTWVSKIHPAYIDAGEPRPNFRLSESNVHFDANKDMEGWQTVPDAVKKFGFRESKELGEWGCSPWNDHQKRPIPMWKEFEIRSAKLERIPGEKTDTVKAYLPYNMQMTPIITLTDSSGGSLVDIRTDHTVAGGQTNIRAQYTTKKGTQTYESLGWMNGQIILLEVPKNVKIDEVKYRETGYDTNPDGEFFCDDDFYMRFWKKGLNTLYINMRDNYFDCPDRERAQWWGDAVVLMGESFYTYSASTHAIMRKAIRELVSWQKDDGVLYSPIPGNFKSELPGQMLASIGRYGFWNYYMNTGDIETIKYAYPAIKKYLSLWELDNTGLTVLRKGGWTWGDWGDNRDMRLIFAGWHYIALSAAADMADILGFPQDAKSYRSTMEKVKSGYNKCWNGFSYRHPEYNGSTDDRVQALAVISGIADKDLYESIFKLFKTQMHASPYMEKYVMEALFKIGHGDYAMERTKQRFANMVNDKFHTTLFEGWEIGGFGGGSTNHAWSGGTITVISQYLCGLYPLEPAWKTFRIEPTPVKFKEAAISIPTVSGTVKSSYSLKDGKFSMKVSVPSGTTAMLYLPTFVGSKSISVNGDKELSKYGADKFKHPTKRSLKLPAGEYSINVE